MSRENRVFGPPGAGKTSFLTRQIGIEAERHGADRILVSSFTRTAAAELKGRDLPIPENHVGTLHSLCYRSMGCPQVAETGKGFRAWNEWLESGVKGGLLPASTLSFKVDLESGSSRDVDDPYGDQEDRGGTKSGSGILSAVNYARARLVQPGTPNWTLCCGRFGVTSMEALGFQERWTEFKRETGMVDFADMIEHGRGTRIPDGCSVLMVDEAQDLCASEIAVVRRWSEDAEVLFLAGDDDQASLPGTMVARGESESPVAVERLDQTKDRLLAYDLRGASVVGKRRGIQFRVAPSRYVGDAVCVRSGGRSTWTTHNHPWIVRWARSALNLQAVYVMRRGTRWRVGRCQILRADGCTHFTTRCLQERADAGWILRTFGTVQEAAVHEAFVAACWGLPTSVWRPVNNQSVWSRKAIDDLWELLDPLEQARRAMECLRVYGRDPGFPLYEPNKAFRFGRKRFTVRGCNLLSEAMEVPVVDGDGVSWAPIEGLAREGFDGLVYGLEVENHHNYFADGILTHNCIYGFRGATPEAFLDPPVPADQKRVLSLSYRLPRAIKATSEEWIKQLSRREPKDFRPRDEDGEVGLIRTNYRDGAGEIADVVEAEVSGGRTVMVLALCSYMLSSIIDQLRDRGVPFANPYRPRRGDWNPLRGGAQRVESFLRPADKAEPRLWTWEELHAWFDLLDSKRAQLRRGAKKAVKAMSIDPERYDRVVSLDDLAALFGDRTRAEAWTKADPGMLVTNLVNEAAEKTLYYPLQIWKKRGVEALRERPMVTVGTVHSVKGGESDVVILCSDISSAARREIDCEPDGEDAGFRVFYVGMTRARQRLLVTQPALRSEVVRPRESRGILSDVYSSGVGRNLSMDLDRFIGE